MYEIQEFLFTGFYWAAILFGAFSVFLKIIQVFSKSEEIIDVLRELIGITGFISYLLCIGLLHLTYKTYLVLDLFPLAIFSWALFTFSPLLILRMIFKNETLANSSVYNAIFNTGFILLIPFGLWIMFFQFEIYHVTYLLVLFLGYITLFHLDREKLLGKYSS